MTEALQAESLKEGVIGRETWKDRSTKLSINWQEQVQMFSDKQSNHTLKKNACEKIIFMF